MKVGQTVYLRPTGNAARRSTEIKEAVITKVGRKYFEVEPSYFGRFNVDTMYQDGRGYVSDYQAYLSLGAIEEERETHRILDEIQQRYFRGFSKVLISPSQARAIADILGIK